ncbi:MAG: CvpA family protein [Clostridia bacterium]|nr:CvpA family protein [Clostridia bacterium]
MGIIIDIILLAIIILSAFLGYKKGLVKLGTRLFAGIIAIIITIIIYKPVAGLIISNTAIDEKIEDAIMQNTTNFIKENTQQNQIANHVANEFLPDEAKNMSKNIVYAITGLILFIVVQIALSVVITLMDFVANLPILKQFNEIGGIIYGIVRGVIIICVCILLMGVFAKINPESKVEEKISNSYLTQIIYKNIVKF